MDLSALSKASAPNSAPPAPDQSSLITNYDAFLQLLTTQIKNQSPLDPMDANQFTQQLVQFSTVEQAIKSNQNLTDLIAATKTANATNLLSYVGANVTAEGTGTTLSGGKALWQYTSDKAGTGTVTVRNSLGAVVFNDRPTLAAGSHTYSWNGRMTNGQIAPDGEYSIEIAGTDKDGAALSIGTTINGTVTGIDLSGAEPVLKIGSQLVPMSGLRSVNGLN